MEKIVIPIELRINIVVETKEEEAPSPEDKVTDSVHLFDILPKPVISPKKPHIKIGEPIKNKKPHYGRGHPKIKIEKDVLKKRGRPKKSGAA